MIAKTRSLALSAIALVAPTLAACQTPDATNRPEGWHVSVRDVLGVRGLQLGPHRRPAPTEPVHVPDLGGGLFTVQSGEFHFAGDLTHGEASFEDAVIWDAESDSLPSAYGDGHFALDIDGTHYETRHALSAATVLDEVNEAGESYFVIGGYTLSSDTEGGVMTALWAMVPRADVAPGAVLILDGTRNLGVFATGHVESETGPELLAIAAIGTLTLGDDLPADLAIGSTVSATIEGEFGRVEAFEWTPPSSLTSGDYTLRFAADAPLVDCNGTLAGRATELASATPGDLGLEAGAITVALPDDATMILSGASIERSVAMPSVTALRSDDPPAFVAQASHDGPAIAGTVRLGTTFLVATDVGPEGLPVILLVTMAEDPSDSDAGRCDVAFSATIAP